MKKYILNLFVSSLTLSGLCQATDNVEQKQTAKCYEMMGGKPTLESWGKSGEKTYGRSYEEPDFNINVKNLSQARTQLNNNGRQCKEYGEYYNRPFEERPRYNFVGGGFFLTLKTLEEKQASLSSCQYALSVFGEQQGSLAGIPLKVIQHQWETYGTYFIVNHYFECTREPKDGDLVVYPNGTGDGYIHSGIYRKSEPHWNSPDGGTVESKWSNIGDNLYIFQHDVFFVPPSYGKLALFYSLKKQLAASFVILSDFPHIPTSVYEIQKDGYFAFCRTEVNSYTRRNIDHNQYKISLGQFSGIKVLSEKEDYSTICSSYALNKILTNYKETTFSSLSGLPDNNLIETSFKITTEPKKGDLVCYYHRESLTKAVHFGIYCSDGLVESKWGIGSVYEHPPFHVMNMYGDYIRYYTLR